GDELAVANIAYAVAHEDYLHDVQEDRTTINGSAAGTWHAVDQRLDAIFSHQVSETLADRRQVDSPNNQDQRSITTGGLDAFLHLSSVDSVILSPRYVDVRFDENDQSNSERKELTLSLEHRLAQISTLDLSVTY